MPLGIYKRTEEARKNMSKAHKGKYPTEETRRKMGLAHKGHPVSEETRKKQSEASKGKKKSLAHRQNMSKVRKGKPSGTKGMHWKIKDSSKMGKGRLGKGIKMLEYPENIRIRKSIEYILWRKSIFERYNFTCQKCNQSGGRLVAHHIFNFADYPEQRLNINNGITLCQQCHDDFHKIYGKHNNTKEQLTEFLKNEKTPHNSKTQS